MTSTTSLPAPAPPPSPPPVTAVEIFRAGTHVTQSGETLTFAEADLAAIAAAYDPAVHQAPMVIGHPATDSPAYGWVQGLRVQGGRLLADLADVDPAFSELHRAGRYRFVSAAFYRPNSGGNPKPGQWYLRHVGMLGAEPPAVKGLRPAQFRDGGTDVVAFADGPIQDLSWAVRSLARILRRVRDHFVSTLGVEKADEIIAPWELDWAQDDAAKASAADSGPTFKEPAMPTPTAADQAAEMEARAKKLRDQEAALAERERKLRQAEHDAFFSECVAAGRFIPIPKERLVKLFDTVDAQAPVAFAEGEQPRRPSDEVKWIIKACLGKKPPDVQFGEHAAGAGGEDLAAWGKRVAGYGA